VIGVAVLDKPEDTAKAIEELGISWPVMIDAQNIPTDLYGIMGVPSVILVGPDGIIVSRDRHGDELKSIIAEVLK